MLRRGRRQFIAKSLMVKSNTKVEVTVNRRLLNEIAKEAYNFGARNVHETPFGNTSDLTAIFVNNLEGAYEFEQYLNDLIV